MDWRRWFGGAAVAVTGTVGPEGVCGERRAGDAAWTIRVRLAPWAQRGCAFTDAPLELTRRGDEACLRALQARWRPGRQVAARVRFGRRPLRATLVEALDAGPDD